MSKFTEFMKRLQPQAKLQKLFQDKLKEIYKKQDKIAQLIEGSDEIPQQTMQDYYVKLQTVIRKDEEQKSSIYESIPGEKQAIEVENIFDKLAETSDAKNPNKLLILGAAGVGKSTLMQYMSYQWSIGEIWSGKFDYVYRVNLKTLLNNEWKEKYKTEDIKDSKLKCLAHYHLIADLTRKEKTELNLGDITWSADKTKILLLLDGYDEVAHLRNTLDYKDIFEEIFEHQNLIITSRPNAVDKKMKEKFDRIIENTGLDNNGIKQYFTKYFKRDTERGGEKGEELQTLLNGNAVIKGICHIPVNIAMLCYIWSMKRVDQILEILNVSDLYAEVVNRLGYRYFAKTWKGEKEEGTTLERKLSNGEFILDELKVLSHVAYKGITGGGIDKDDNGRLESLIIKGSVGQKDDSGISIQSSINYLATREEIKNDTKSKVDINQVYQYGLLRTEKVVTQFGGQESEILETDLQKQAYSFIHLTFQEYLAGYYLLNQLKTKKIELVSLEEKKEICQFIAEHRNEPRYLMMLKFMAGIVTADRSKDGNKISQIFWESVTCNIDGTIELGVETKVNMLMHLLGQARIKGGIDSQIPNIALILQLIDVVLLKDLLAWGNQLKETDYISENIKQGLLTGLLKGNLEFNEKTIREIQDKMPKLATAIGILINTKTPHVNSNIIISSCIEIVTNIINKFNQQEQIVINKLKEIIAKETSATENKDWQLTKQAIDGITKIATQVKLPKETVEILVELLMPRITDANYTQTAMQSIVELLNNVKDQTLLTKVLDQFINLNDPYWRIRKLMQDGVIKILKSLEDETLTWSIIDTFSKVDINTDVREEAVHGFATLVKSLEYPKITNRVIDKLSKCLADKNDYVRDMAISSIATLVQSLEDTELTKRVIDKLSKCLADKECYVKQKAISKIAKLAKSPENPELTKMAIDKLSKCLADKNDDVIQMAIDNIARLVQGREYPELTKMAIDKLSKCLADKNDDVIQMAIDNIARLVQDREYPELTESVIDKLSKCLADRNDYVRKMAIDSIAKLVQSLKNPGLTKSVIDKIIPLLADIDDGVRNVAKYGIATLVRSLKDPGLTKSVIDKIIPLLADIDDGVRNVAKYDLAKLVRSLKDPKPTESVIDKLSKCLADQDWYVRQMAIDSIAKLVQSLKDPELTESVIDKLILIPLLADIDDDVRNMAIDSIAKLVQSLEDSELTKSVIDKIISLLADRNDDVRKMAIDSIAKLVQSLEDSELTKSVIDKIISLLADRNDDVRKMAIDSIAKLVQSQIQSQEDLEFTQRVIDTLISFPITDNLIRQQLENIIADITADSLLLPKEKFIRYLNHPSKEIRDGLVNDLGKSFKDFLKKMQLLEELTKNKNKKILQFEIIKEKLFDNNLDQILQEQIKNLHDLANSNDQVIQEENLTTLKGIILSRINKIGNVKSHELIEIALLVIANADISDDDSRKKELVQSAKEVINCQIEYLSNEGLKWINVHFEDLVKISKDSKLFVRKLYHKILANLISTQDADFTELAKELIIKSINCGMTTSISKTGEIIFEGKKYILEGGNKDVILEEIARAVINQDQDILARQYREHEPLFSRTGKELEQAAADVKAKSILGDQIELSHVTWRVSLMHLSDHKKQEPNEVFVLLERRDAFGYHIVHKIYVEASNICYQFGKKHPNEISTDFRKEVFGEMKYVETKPRYYCSIKNKISLEEGTQLIQQSKDYKLEEGEDVYVTLHKLFNNKLYDPTWENIPWKEYVQQESIQTFKKNVLLKIPSELVRSDSMSVDTHLKFQEVIRSLQKVIQGSDITQQDKKEMQQHLCDIEQKVKRLETQEIKDIVTRLTDLTTKGQNMRTRLKDLEDDVDRLQNQTDTNISAYRLDKIIYDNPLLNHTELLEVGLKILNFNQILDLTPQLDPNLVSIAINTDDSLLILAGLLSLTHSD